MEENEFLESVEKETAPVDETEGEATTPEQVEGEEAPEEHEEPTASDDKRSGLQKRIDELVRKREEAKRERDYWREQALKQANPQTEESASPKLPWYPDLPKPKSDDFETYDDFVEALADWKAEVKVRQVQERAQNQQMRQGIKQWHEQAKQKYQDWQAVFTDDLNISETMAEVMLNNPDTGIDVGYYLATNPGIADRIFAMSPARQAYEMGKLESKLAALPQKSKTNAPAPTSPVGGKEIPSKKPEDMSYDEYKQWRAQGGGK